MAGVGPVMTDTTLLETGWSEALEAIGTALDVEASARSSGALKRARAVRDGAGLLRLALAYGGCGLSLRQTAAWAAARGIADLSLPRPRGHPVKVHHAAPAICSWAWAGVKKPRPECRRRRL